MSKDSVTTSTEIIQKSGIWTLEKEVTIVAIRKRLKELAIEPITTSTVVSYCFGESGDGDLTTYSTSASYIASPEVDTQQKPRIFQKSYYKPTDSSWNAWYVVYENRPISEEEFYEVLLYSRPERVINFQHLLFTRGSLSYAIEINPEARMTLLKVSGDKSGGESIFSSMIEEPISHEDYLWRTFSNDSYNRKISVDGDMGINATNSDRKVA